MKITGIGNYSTLAQKVEKELLSLGVESEQLLAETKSFSDGERYHRLEAVRNEDVVIISGTVDDAHTLDMYDIACAAVKYGAKSLHLVIPYFGYSTMERAIKPREVVKAKTRCRLFSVVPSSHQGNHIYFLDLHAEGMQHYVESNLENHHLYAESLILDMITNLTNGDFVIASTDAGRAKWVESLANHLGVNAAFCLKHRSPEGVVSLSAVSADVMDKHVVIYDDMIRTGSSLVQAARAYHKAGASKISVVTTHGVFPADSLQKLLDDPLISHISITDSYQGAESLPGSPKLTCVSVAKLLATHIVDQLDK